MKARPRRSTRHSRRQQLAAAFVPALIVTLSITGFVWAQRGITLVVDGASRPVRSHASTVGELLEEAAVSVDSNDVINPSPETDVSSGMTVVVRHAVPVTVRSGDEVVRVDVVGETVADALVAAGLDPSGNAGVSPSLTSSLRPGMTITVPELLVRVESRQAAVAPAVRRKSDSTLRKGVTRVIDQGRPGKMLRVYRVLVSDGVESAPVLATEQVIERPQPRLIAVGTAVRPRPAMSAPSRAVRMVATGYSPEQPGLDGTTATGARARHGVAAVDPCVIPLGTRLYVPGYGFAIAADTGGAIRGNRIDLCFDTVADALVWGRRSITVYVLR